MFTKTVYIFITLSYSSVQRLYVQMSVITLLPHMDGHYTLTSVGLSVA